MGSHHLQWVDGAFRGATAVGVMAVMAAVAAMVEVGVAAVSVGSMKSPSCISTPARQLRTCRMGVRAEMGVGG